MHYSIGTGYTMTTVTSTAGGYVLSRTPGPDRAGPLRSPGPAERRALAGLRSGGTRLLLPAVRGDRREWVVPGPRSLALILVAGGPADSAGLLAEVGRILRTVHDTGAPALPRPAGPARWQRWLAGAAGTRQAGRLRDTAGQRCGPARLDVLAGWLAEQLAATARLVHGAPGLAGLWPGPGATAGLLAGDELAAGAPAGDLAWLLGELAELAARAGPTVTACCRELARALLSGYGPTDRAALDRWTVVRMLGHAHDYAAAVGWHDQLTDQLDLVSALVDGHRERAALALAGIR